MDVIGILQTVALIALIAIGVKIVFAGLSGHIRGIGAPLLCGLVGCILAFGSLTFLGHLGQAGSQTVDKITQQHRVAPGQVPNVP